MNITTLTIKKRIAYLIFGPIAFIFLNCALWYPNHMTGGTKRQKDMRKALRILVPRVPMADAEAILALALAGHLRHLPPSIALWQATTSHIRHNHTDYDTLLDNGYDRDATRFFVIDAMNLVLENWGCQKRLSADDNSLD